MSPTKPQLRLVPGEKSSGIIINKVRIILAPPNKPPFPTEVKIYEEDTLLALSAPPVITAPQEHPIRTLTKIWETEPQPQGSLLIQGRRWLALTHDLDQDPCCDEQAVLSCLNKIWKATAQHNIHTLALPLLGNTYKALPSENSLDLIFSSLRNHIPPLPQKIWLVTSAKGTGRK
ncbi:MAG: hypothetical protein OEM02_10340 [Desulfobulbaceae bacterium]|nr:hypothetical protein [Desulfobulbaceae bacterium]